MALAEYIKDLERGVYGEKEGETLALSRGDDNIPSEKLDSNFLAMLPTLVSILSDREKKKKDEPIYRREIDPYPPPKQQQQQGGGGGGGGGGGLSPLELWDLYNKYRGEGQTPQSTPSGEPASTPAATTAPAATTTPAAGSQGLGYMGGTQAAGGSQGLGYMGGTGATTASGSGAGGSMAGSTGAIALYAILGSLGQKWATKEQMSDDPGRGPTSRKARVFSALAPSAMHAIKDPGGEGIYQLTGHSPVMSLLGKGQGGKGETESEGYKIWKWIGKLFD